MTELAQLLLLGLGAGALYSLAALGLVLVHRSSGVVNFAHGATATAATLVFYDLSSGAGWGTLPAALVGVSTAGLLGLLSYLLAVRWPRGSSTLNSVIVTLAILLIVQGFAAIHYGTEPKLVQQYLPDGPVHFTDQIVVGEDRLILLVVAVLLTGALSIAYRATSFGIATSAVSESPNNLAALGWRIGLLRAANWTLGGVLAGLAGILLAPIAGVSVNNGVLLLIPVLAAALIGRLSSFGLTLLGGLLIGALQAELSRHDGGITGIADAVPFLVIVLVLVARGQSLPVRSFVVERLPHVGSGRISRLGLVATAATLLGATAWLSVDHVNALLTTLLVAIVVLSLVVVLGYAGQLSLAQMTLAGCGALIAAKLVVETGLPFVVAAPLAVLGTVPVGVLVGLPSLRTRGVTLAIATLGLAIAVTSLVFSNPNVSGGTNGLVVSPTGELSIFGLQADSLLHPRVYTTLVLLVLLLLSCGVANLRRGASGRRLLAVRDNERAAAALGIDVVRVKLWAFGLAAAIAACGGVLLAFRNQAVLFDQFGVFDNISVVAFAVVGGAGSAAGALVGGTLAASGVGVAALGSLSGEVARYIDVIGGLLLLVITMTVPDGLVGSVRLPRRTARQSLPDLPEPGHLRVRRERLEVRDLSVSFGGVRALDKVSLSVEPGTVVSLIGPNGAGKTTLIDAVTGFIAARGSVRLGTLELTGRLPHRRARAGLSRSFQSLELFEDLTVLENIACAVDTHGDRTFLFDFVRPARGPVVTAAMAAALRTFRLEDRLNALPEMLSAGERRLVAMARAIASEPAVLLLDEPCAGLDQEERDEVAILIRSLAEDWGMAVLLVEHDVDLVRRVSDLVVVLDFGTVIADGPPEAVLELPHVIAAYLGSPPEAEPLIALEAGR